MSSFPIIPGPDTSIKVVSVSLRRKGSRRWETFRHDRNSEPQIPIRAVSRGSCRIEARRRALGRAHERRRDEHSSRRRRPNQAACPEPAPRSGSARRSLGQGDQSLHCEPAGFWLSIALAVGYIGARVLPLCANPLQPATSSRWLSYSFRLACPAPRRDGVDISGGSQSCNCSPIFAL